MRRDQKRRQEEALRIARLQLRELVMRLSNQGKTTKEIATMLGYRNASGIGRAKNQALRDSVRRARLRRAEASLMPDGKTPKQPIWPPNWRQVPPKAQGARPAQRALPEPASPPPPRAEGSCASGASGPSVAGEVLDPPDVIQLRADVLKLRKAMLPFPEIAELLGVSERDVRRALTEALREIQASEQLNADMHRQLMIEQIDQMIAAIHAPATGQLINGRTVMVDLGAIDRMLKLMDRKAELMGLSAVPAEDIKLQLQRLADEDKYDIVELEEIARDVLAARKLKLPEFR